MVTMRLWYWNLTVRIIALSQVNRLQTYTDYIMITESYHSIAKLLSERQILKK